MAGKSEAALIRLGNLRSRSLTIEAPNRIGMLRDILSVLAGHGIDMTALDSQLLKTDDGSERVPAQTLRQPGIRQNGHLLLEEAHEHEDAGPFLRGK